MPHCPPPQHRTCSNLAYATPEQYSLACNTWKIPPAATRRATAAPPAA
eukprot:CAMPEP_0115665250 /NCGR_PEP_ID=MMETSP0272-20121206/48789_1 /TAXON_ID=71861 /ORGANISM="Scrippsiella trochoidea, Strain CCMP3099" /LENGTH=47 /DNA_ID= /DNA_START= /DNA_END= /DNA_ORIENTATION=